MKGWREREIHFTTSAHSQLVTHLAGYVKAAVNTLWCSIWPRDVYV